ncbi:MAG: hypothetical protein Q9169_007733, partial [Polycauliona sp. 2 TL-2023]
MLSLFCFSAFSTLLSLWPRVISAAGIALPSDPLSLYRLNNDVRPGDDTILSVNVPAGFTIVPQSPRGEAITDLTCLNLAVNIASEVADRSAEALIEPAAENLNGLTFSTGIAMAPAGTRGIQARYVIWGIYRAIQDLSRTGVWQEIVYELKWQGQTMGALGIFKTSRPHLTISNSEGDKDSPSFNQVLQDHFPASSRPPPPSSNNDTLPATPSPNTDLEMVITYPVDPHTPILGQND